MSDEIRTAVDLRSSIVDQRGGIERFDGPQRRLLDALVFELAKKPNEIDVRVVTDLMAMLPRPVSAPEANRPEDYEAMVGPLRRLYRSLHESVHVLTHENAQLRARLGLPVSGAGSTAITPALSAITPPGELGVCHAGPMRGADDPPSRATTVIEAKAAPKAAPASGPPDPPAYSYNANDDWKDFVLPDGNIRTSRGRYWGPV
jgi:hypothetical protein